MNFFSLSILLGVCVLFACKKNDSNLSTDKKHTLRNLSYGEHRRHVLDMTLPKNRDSNTPVVIFIHGGAWVIGDKSVFATEIQNFADNGIACATMNYRYASKLTGIHHPELPYDIKNAVAFIASNAEKWQIASNRFGLVGHSAGGHLSLITSYAFNDGKIKACASWAGPLDFVDNEQLAISNATDVFETYMGHKLETVADTLAYKNASPYWRVSTGAVPTLLIHGTDDDGIPYQNALKMQAKLDNLNIVNEFLTFDNTGHIWMGSTLQEARNTTLEWFKSKL